MALPTRFMVEDDFEKARLKEFIKRVYTEYNEELAGIIKMIFASVVVYREEFLLAATCAYLKLNNATCFCSGNTGNKKHDKSWDKRTRSRKMSFMKKILGRRKKARGAYEEFCEKYNLTDVVLGTGSYAEVRLARSKKTHESVAVKIIDKSELNHKEIRGLKQEVEILKTVNHRNVIKFFDSFEEEDVMYVVMEYVGGGELFDRVVKNDPPFSENDVRQLVRSLAEALQHCKERGVIHRDIKPQNLLLTSAEEGAEVKLVDFNLSIQLDPNSVEFSIVQTMCGTPNYVAPEVLSGKPYDFKCDVWSLGVICFVVLSGGCLPFFVDEEGETGKQRLLRKVMKGKWGFYPRDAWADVSEEAKDFLRKVMERNPEKRIGYKAILKHPWIVGKGDKYNKRIDMSSLQKTEHQRKLDVASAVMRAIDKFKNIGQIEGAVQDKDETSEPEAEGGGFIDEL